MKDIGVLVQAGILPHMIAASGRSVEHFRVMLGMSPGAMKELAAGIAPFTPLKIGLLAEIMNFDEGALASELERFSQDPPVFPLGVGSSVMHPVYGEARVLDYNDGLAKVQLKDGKILSGVDSVTFADRQDLGLELLTASSEDSPKRVVTEFIREGTEDTDDGTEMPDQSSTASSSESAAPEDMPEDVNDTMMDAPAQSGTNASRVLEHLRANHDPEHDNAEYDALIDEADGAQEPHESEPVYPEKFTRVGVDHLAVLSGLSKNKLSIALGFHASFIQGLSRGRRFPPARFEDLAREVGVSPSDLVQIVSAQRKEDLPDLTPQDTPISDNKPVVEEKSEPHVDKGAVLRERIERVQAKIAEAQAELTDILTLVGNLGHNKTS